MGVVETEVDSASIGLFGLGIQRQPIVGVTQSQPQVGVVGIERDRPSEGRGRALEVFIHQLTGAEGAGEYFDRRRIVGGPFNGGLGGDDRGGQIARTDLCHDDVDSQLDVLRIELPGALKGKYGVVLLPARYVEVPQVAVRRWPLGVGSGRFQVGVLGFRPAPQLLVQLPDEVEPVGVVRVQHQALGGSLQRLLDAALLG